MADGHLKALRVGLIAGLKADGPLATLVGARIVRRPHQRITFPYVAVERLESEPWDTDGTEGFQVTVGIEVHSRPNPQAAAEVELVAEAVIAAMHRRAASFTVAGFALVDLLYLTSTTEPENGDGDVIARLAFEAFLDT